MQDRLRLSSARLERAVIETELAVLRALCQGADGEPLWNDAMALLARYRFRNPVYQVVFDALRRIRSPHAQTLRQQLQRELVMARFCISSNNNPLIACGTRALPICGFLIISAGSSKADSIMATCSARGGRGGKGDIHDK